MRGAPGFPIALTELARRTGREVLADDCLGLAAQLAYYFFLALFPALLFLAAIVSFIPVAGLLEAITTNLSHVAPAEVLSIIQDQILKIAHEKNGGLLTLGMIGTIWSSSAGLDAIITTLNQAYDVPERRSWWKVKLLAVGLTLALSALIILAFALLLVGPPLAERIAIWAHMGRAFVWTWTLLQWPVIFLLVSFALATIYYYAPAAAQDWLSVTPGALVATTLWILISLGFKFYVAHFGSYNATYGTIGAVIVLMLWFYLSALAVLVGAELNAEIEHASAGGHGHGENAPATS